VAGAVIDSDDELVGIAVGEIVKTGDPYGLETVQDTRPAERDREKLVALCG